MESSDGTEWRHQTTVSGELKRVFFNSLQEESEELRNIFREESEQRMLWENILGASGRLKTI
jgi:hypothetical protein